MCVAEGSVALYTRTCPMCQVYRPSKPQCPHKTEICRNRVNHPQFNVVYLTNAEVQTFQGCGYCKWASKTPAPSTNKAGMHNPGWPGCCRPPQPHEYVMIQPADWLAVNIVHKTPVPADIKKIIDEALKQASPMRGPTPERRPPGLGRTNSSPTSTVSRGTVWASAVAIPQKAHRGGGSPQSKPSSLVGSGSNSQSLTHSRIKDAQHGAAGSSTGNSSSDHTGLARRSGAADKPVKRIEGFRTTPPSSVRKLADAEHNASHPPVSRTTNLVAAVVAGSGENDVQPSLKRRSSTRSVSSVSISVTTTRTSASPKSKPKAIESKPEKPPATETSPERVDLEKGMKALSIRSVSDSSSDSGSRSSGSSITDNNTVTSDGGFTDYLSDESEAELQRQAEVRAAILEQNRMEELEFRAARQQLASVDLRPPQVWTTGVTSARKAMKT